MAVKKRVFTSFDFENDDDLRTLLVGQSKRDLSPFEIADWSLKEALDGDWKKKIRDRIKRTEVVVVICGHYTDTATGVSAELKIAQDEGIPYFLLHGRSSGTVKRPKAAKSTDKVYNWTWKNLGLLIQGNR